MCGPGSVHGWTLHRGVRPPAVQTPSGPTEQQLPPRKMSRRGAGSPEEEPTGAAPAAEAGSAPSLSPGDEQTASPASSSSAASAPQRIPAAEPLGPPSSSDTALGTPRAMSASLAARRRLLAAQLSKLKEDESTFLQSAAMSATASAEARADLPSSAPGGFPGASLGRQTPEEQHRLQSRKTRNRRTASS